MELLDQRDKLEESLHRAKRSLKSLDRYLDSLTAVSTPASSLMAAITEYNTGAQVYQNEIRSIREARDRVSSLIAQERLSSEERVRNPRLNQRVSVAISAQESQQVEVTLVYGTFLF